MRVDETGNPTPKDEKGSDTPGDWPDPPSEGLAAPDPARHVTSSGIGMTGGTPVGSATDRKVPDTWAREHSTLDNVGPGALDVKTGED